MRIKYFLVLLFPLFIISCDPAVVSKNPTEVEGFVPVYSNDISAIKQISSESSRATEKAGKIYTSGNLLFQVELDSGIHIINYSNPNDPKKIGFIKSWLCKEVSVKNGFIYTNNMADLVVIDISNLNNVHEVSRVANVFPDLALQYPPKENSFEFVYFECPDPSKGVIVSWKKQIINNPKCRR